MISNRACFWYLGKSIGNMYAVVANMFTVHSTMGRVFSAIYMIDDKNPEWGYELEVNEAGDVYIVNYEELPKEHRVTRNGMIVDYIETYGEHNVAYLYFYKTSRAAFEEKFERAKEGTLCGDESE